jgi:hypothetical protein
MVGGKSNIAGGKRIGLFTRVKQRTNNGLTLD